MKSHTHTVEVVIATPTNEHLAKARAVAKSVGCEAFERHSPNTGTPYRLPADKAAELLAAAAAAGLKTYTTIRPAGWYSYDSVDRTGTFGWGGEGWAYSFGGGRWKALIWKAGCHPNVPWHGTVVDGDWSPYYGDMQHLAYHGDWDQMDPDLRKAMPRDVKDWAKGQGLPLPWTYWQADAVPIDQDGLVVFDWPDDGFARPPKITPEEYFAKSNWTDAAQQQRGPCPWRDGELVGPTLAADVTGMDADECAKLSDKWFVIVRWFDDEEGAG